MHSSFKHSLLGLLASQWNTTARADGSRRLLTAPVLCIAALALSGCLAQSQIQSKYMSSQEDCRNSTARSVAGGETARPVTENQASPIAARFSECMTKEGWHLATPKPVVIANNPPTGSPSTNPSAALKSSYPQTVTGPPASAYPPQSSYPPPPTTANTYYNTTNNATTTQNSGYYPPSGAPSTNPSAAAARVAPVAATAPVARTAPVAQVAQPAAAAVARTAPVANAAPVAQTAPVAGTAATAAANGTRLPQTTIPTSPDTAIYQPGRPSGEAVPFYGTGPGRQF